MSYRKSQVTLHLRDSNNREAVQQEIDRFLQALSSYPDRFAHDPYLSFEQHLCSIMSSDREPHVSIRVP